ncbi:MAG: hypothetical protein E4G94_07630 [ANME-2 cluster archaeon]|nr:MAG: hypothetical protein E4G94_07630 [ANME-2 cluster archaeon]
MRNICRNKLKLDNASPIKNRIVAKVDQLMALCDKLEAGLVQAQTDGGKLMEAVVHHVLGCD